MEVDSPGGSSAAFAFVLDVARERGEKPVRERSAAAEGAAVRNPRRVVVFGGGGGSVMC